ncbi:MAG TPA: DUF4390 domain-containing protein [Thermoanaerobaculia bacterium]|nr:DUF4390 domain-containing protein [Thermoanaerobaculia bacterium]
MRARPLLVRAVALLIAAGPIAARPALAADAAEIVDLMVERNGERLLVSFQLVGGFDEAVRQKIESGLPTGFTYQIKLERVRKWWLNGTIEHARVEVFAMYNAITREYLVNVKLDGKLIDSRTVKSLGDAERAMSIVHALPVFELDEVPDARMVLRVRAELGSKNFLGLFPTTVSTGWAEVRSVQQPFG